jgi:hypothetical protein
MTELNGPPDPPDDVEQRDESRIQEFRDWAEGERRRDWVRITIVTLLGLLFLATTWQLGSARTGEQEARSTSLSLAEQVQAECDEPAVEVDLTICRQAEQIIDDPQNPDVPEGPPGDQGQKGPAGRAPTVAEIEAAVLAVLRTNPELTEPQIIVAVADYLAEHPPPPGPAGAQGGQGEPGAAATAEQIAAAVADFCADGACQGKQGDPGPPGDFTCPAGTVQRELMIFQPAGQGERVPILACVITP